MPNRKSTFALFFGNRGFFPASLIAGARKELPAALRKLGHKSLTLGAEATNHGAVETPKEGEVYAQFLRQNRGKFSIMDVFFQYGVPFTVLPPHTVAPREKDFAAKVACV